MAVITSSPTQFGKLLQLQESANENLHSIRTILDSSRASSSSSDLASSMTRPVSSNNESLEIEKETLATQQEMLEQMRQDARARAADAADIAKLAQGVTTFKSIGEKLREGFGSFTSKFSPSNLKKSFLSATNVGGINNRQMAKDEFIEQQKTLGVTGSRAELSEKFDGAQTAAKSLQVTESQLDKLKQSTGLSEDQLGKTDRGRELLQQRDQASSDFAKFDARAGLVASGPMEKAPMTASTAFQSAGEDKELQVEEARKMTTQNDLLEKIEENTRGDSPDQKASGASGGGGLLGGIGKGLQGLGVGLGKGIQGLLMGAGKGLLFLAKGLIALTPAIPVIGVLTLAAIGLGKALQIAAPAIEAFAPVLMKLAEVIGGVVIAAIERLPEIFRVVGDVVIGIISAISDGITGIIDSVTTSIERLAAIDGSNLMDVGAGLLAVAGGLVAFGAGGAVAGVGNLVSGLLGAVTPGGGPIEQIIRLAERGTDIETAGIGVEKLANGLGAFSSIDTDRIKAIAALPVDKIAAMGAAMQTPSAGVIVGSAQNQSAIMANQSGGGSGQTNVVNAPVSNVSQQTNLIKSPTRNQESSQSRYIGSRWVGA